MTSADKNEPPQHVQFPSTHWSIVVAAGHQSSPNSDEALESLCAAYWYPLYAYVRRRVADIHEAQDLMQEFFAKLLEKNYIADARQERGRFRAFLLTVVDDAPLSDIHCDSCGSEFSLIGDPHKTVPTSTERSKIGHFQLTQQLGMGAFGTVWRAQDTELDRKVAIKFPRKGQISVAEAEQFLREARAAAQLKHPNIVSVHEVGRRDDQIYIVSDFVDGMTLAERLTTDPPSAHEAVQLCVKVAAALHHAHESGVIHRDLKPANIMLDEYNEPYLTDFGLAKRESAEKPLPGEVKVWDARPWTPKLRTESQARGLLLAHRDRVKSLAELEEEIRSDRTISNMVRKQALDWAEVFWKKGKREPE